MKITLINPKHYIKILDPLPPLGLMYLAAFSRKNGFGDISIIDLEVERVEDKKLVSIISDSDIVGVTGFTSQFNDAARISGFCKKMGVLSLAGGVHATALPKEVLEKSDFDIVVRSEGERTFLEILKSLEKKEGFDHIKGISFRKNNKIIENEGVDFISNLDDLPYPAWDLIDKDRYAMTRNFFGGKYAIMLTSRGCPNICTFCQSPVTWKAQARFRSSEDVFNEIVELKEKHGFNCIFIEDDTFTLVKKRVFEICRKLIDNKVKMQFACGTRPGTLDEELLNLMRDAGWVRISMGAESGNEEMLKRIKKNYTLSEISRGFHLIKNSQITSLAYMIIGLPGENLRSFWKSFKYARSLKADSYQWTILVPFPGTEIFNKRMVKIINFDYSRWTYWEPVIKVGYLNPFMLKILLYIAQNGTEKEHHRLGDLHCLLHVLFFHTTKDLIKKIMSKILRKKDFELLKNFLKRKRRN